MSTTGEPLVSDIHLRANMPPDVKKTSDRNKEMYSCITCIKMKLYQESLVSRFRKGVLQQLKEHMKETNVTAVLEEYLKIKFKSVRQKLISRRQFVKL